MFKMELNKLTIVGDWSFVGEGKVIDSFTGKEVSVRLRFKANNVGFETTEVDGIRSAKLNNNLINGETGTLWDMIVLD
jgi:hypothetical protein